MMAILPQLHATLSKESRTEIMMPEFGSVKKEVKEHTKVEGEEEDVQMKEEEENMHVKEEEENVHVKDQEEEGEEEEGEGEEEEKPMKKESY